MIDLTRSYCGPAPAPDAWWAAWNLDPVLLALLVASLIAAGRLPSVRRSAGMAAAGLLAIAFISPLCALTTALFTARSVHHLLLVAAAAPLLAVAWPTARGGIGLALAALTAVLWLWHVPPLYDAALGNVALYWAMQILLLATAWWFWSLAMHVPVPSAAVALTGAAAQMGLLGALLTFAPRPLYATHLASTVPYGIGPLADQQLAGLVMWLPGMIPFALAAGWIVARRWRAMGPAAA